MRKLRNTLLFLALTAMLILGGCAGAQSDAGRQTPVGPSDSAEWEIEGYDSQTLKSAGQKAISLEDIPPYSKDPYVVLNDNVPLFSEAAFTTESFESYSELDSLGRCGAAYANIGTDLMPTEKRGAIGQVKPSGWQTVKYDFVDGKYLYNRCHLIGYQLTAENANDRNLITGTRYMNVEGMLPFENMVADYIKETGNHVLYRVTPLFRGDNLVADGVVMEAESVEDKGEGILFHVFVYNVQPGVAIDYATGTSRETEDGQPEAWTAAGDGKTEDGGRTEAVTKGETAKADSTETTYIFNTNTHKFHKPSCSSVSQMDESNKQSFTGSRGEAIAQGYEPCGRCKP